MPSIEVINNVLEATMEVAKDIDDLTLFATGWLLSELKKGNNRTINSVLSRAEVLEQNLKTPKLDKQLLQDQNYLLNWVQSVTTKTDYVKRVAASKSLLKLDEAKTGKSAASFWPFPGINDRSRYKLRELHPIDFISPADDPRQRPVSVDRIKGTAERIFNQREIEPALYYGYLGPIDWLWQYLSVLNPYKTEVEGIFGTLCMQLAPPKSCILSAIQYTESKAPVIDCTYKKIDIKYELQLLKAWQLTGREFTALLSLRHSEVADIFLRKQGHSKLGNMFKARIYTRNTSDIFDIPVDRADLRDALVYAAQEADEKKKIQASNKKWDNPPSAYAIQRVILNRDIRQLAGGIERALPTIPSLGLERASRWLHLSQCKGQQLQLAIQAIALAWSCGCKYSALPKHVERRAILTKYCTKNNLNDPNHLSWTDLDEWLILAEQCSVTSKYFERCEESKKLIAISNETHILCKKYLTPEVALPNLYYYIPDKLASKLILELEKVITAATYSFKMPLSPIEIFMGGDIKPTVLVTILEHEKELTIEEENNLYNLLQPTDAKAYLSENLSDILHRIQFIRRTNISYTPNDCVFELCTILAKNCLTDYWEENSRLAKIPSLTNPSAILLELHRVFLSTLKRLEQERKQVIKKIKNNPQKLNNLKQRCKLGVPFINLQKNTISELFRLDQQTMTLREEIDIRLARRGLQNLMIKDL